MPLHSHPTSPVCPDQNDSTAHFRSVGLGLGRAIRVALARPDCITALGIGDGAPWSLGEIETAARLGLLPLVLVYSDSAAGAESLYYGPLGYELDIVRFPDDVAAIARAAGMEAITARAPADLQSIAKWAVAPTGPLLVDAKIDPTAPPGPWLTEAFRKPR